jgi:hypothetical protein
MKLLPLLLAGSSSWAAGNFESCLNKCSVELGEDGKTNIVCRCDLKDSSTKLWGKAADPRLSRVLPSRLKGATPEEIKAVAENACGSSKGFRKFPAEIESLAELTQRPLCECVRVKVHFPLSRQCKFTAAGEHLCQFNRAQTPKPMARPVSLYDYQSCISARQNYEPPQACEAQACSALRPTCAAHEKLTNIADPEGCCPVFTCQPIPTETL